MSLARFAQVAVLVLFSAILISPLVPKSVSADWQNCNGSFWNSNYNNTYNCAPGTLHVYVTVMPDTQFGQTLQSSNFTTVVTGQNSSPASFQGSASGVNVAVNGPYSVQALPVPGYTPSYSVGCNNSIGVNEEGTCIVTENPTENYNSQPQLYPYPYQPPVLSCASAYQTIPLGATASFSAVGNTGGPYNWATPLRSYQAIGPVLNIAFQNTGTQTVTVSDGTQIATCTVTVVANGSAVLNTLPPGVYPQDVYVAPPTSIVTNYIPQLPNTGFEPHSLWQFALALIALVGAGLLAAPYVRKTVAIALG